MRIINVTPDMTVLPLGRLGENERTQFVFDVNEWLAEYPDANIGLMVRLPHAEDSYPVILSDEGDGKFAWTVTSADLSVEGTGKCQLKAIKNQVIVKSKRYNTRIDDALDGAGDAPAEWESWLDAIQRAAGLAIIKDGKLRFAINDAGHLIMSYTEDVPIDDEGDSTTTEDDVTWIHKDLGPVEAYAQAVAGGYTGTKAEWIAEIANASTNAQLAEDYKEASEQAKDDAQAAAATASAAYNTDLLAPVYTSYTTYKKGDFVIYDGGLYRAKETHSSTTWNADNWESVTFNTVVRAMQEKADNLLTEVGDEVIYDFIDGKYISTTTTHTVGDTLSLTPASSPRYVYTIREVSPGDVVTIEKAFTYGESSPYIFIDADNKILAIGASGTVTDVTVTAPANTAKLVINSYRTDLGMCYVNKLIKDRVLEKPETAGTQGQVLTSDGQGGVSWEDPTGGDPTEIIDDTAGEGDTDKVWSADKSSELLTQITNAQGDVSDLKSALNAEYTELSESGYISPTGGESTNAEYGRTGFIAFSPADKFYLYAFRNGTALAYAFYSDAKASAFISGAGNLNGNLSSDDITIPPNTKYVRFSTWLAQSPNAKVIVNNITGVQAEITGVQAEINALKADYSIAGYIGTNGSLGNNSDYRTTEFIPCDSKTVISLVGVWTGTSSLGYAFYSSNDESSFISGQNSVQSNVIVTSIPTGAKYVRLCSRISNGETPIGIVANYLDAIEKIIALSGEIGDKLSEVAPENTTFFAGINYFNPNKTTFYTDRFCNTDGSIRSGTNTCSISMPVKPNTHYIIYLPDSNRGIVGESSVNNFAVGITITPIYTSGHKSNDRIEFTTGATANYVMIYFNSGSYDYATKKADFVLNKDVYTGNATPYIPNAYLPTDVGNPLYGKQLLIFGDSITDTCNFTINANDETTAVTWKNPSNSYVDAGGTTIYYSMWPKILKDSQGFAEIRNYARQGASYKTSSRTSGNERQNLQYQITVALNDKDNPNNAFEIDDFVPDIVIFALGTNDGTPNDTFESAMNKTVLKSDGYSIDVDATLAALDESKFCESARKAFMRIKQAFPLAQIFCVLPIQRANNDINRETLHQYLKEMAERYGCIIIDGTGSSGITRDFNNWNALGLYLKDGLHPNEKGQNLMARMILSELKSKYLPFGTGFNTVYGQ